MIHALTQKLPLHPEEGRKVCKNRNLNFELMAIVAFSLISVMASFSVLNSAEDVATQAAQITQS